MPAEGLELDRHIGERIRKRRTQMGLTQEQLARALHVSYQQIQKYERGTNRIPAVRLHRIARRLGVDIAYFFAGWEEPGETAAGAGGERGDQGLVELARYFIEVENPEVRRAVRALLRAVSERQQLPVRERDPA